jgi:hypothetical protein
MTSCIALFALSPDAVMVVQNELRHALMTTSVCALVVSMNFCEMHLDAAHWINLGLSHCEIDNLSIVIFGELSR